MEEPALSTPPDLLNVEHIPTGLDYLNRKKPLIEKVYSPMEWETPLRNIGLQNMGAVRALITATQIEWMLVPYTGISNYTKRTRKRFRS